MIWIARQRIDTATILNPDYPLIQHYDDLYNELLDEIEFEEDEERENKRDYGDLFKTNLTDDMSLQTCLETHSKANLVNIVTSLGKSRSGKKSELVLRIVSALNDIDFIQIMLKLDLFDD